MTETPDAHMVETLRLRTAALHRVSRSNDQLRRENDDLRARLADAEAKLAKVNEYADTIVRPRSWPMALDLRTITAGVRVVAKP